jgi:hypothetical protein
MISARYALLGRCRSKTSLNGSGIALVCLFVPNVNCGLGAFVLGSGARGPHKPKKCSNLVALEYVLRSPPERRARRWLSQRRRRLKSLERFR